MISSKGQQRVIYLITAALALLALVSFIRTLSKMNDPASGGLDFHAIWHSGHALRQREDPFRFSLERRAPDPPVYYLDGPVTTEPPVAIDGFPLLSTNTAPVYLPLATLSFLSWSLAPWVMLAINIIFMLIIPGLVIRMFPYNQRLSTADKLLLYLLFFSLTSTRVMLWLGQTTFISLALMLGCYVLRERHPLWAGVLLGFALSKYSVAAGVVLFLIWEWRRRNLAVLGVAVLVQALGVLIVSWLGRVSPWAILLDYQDVFQFFMRNREGLRLSQFFPAAPFVELAVPVLLTLLVFGLLIWLRIKPSWPEAMRPLADHEAVSILVLWSLLVAYHRIYDYSIAIIAAPLGLQLFYVPQTWQMHRRAAWIVLGLIVGAFAVFVMPGSIVEVVLPTDLVELWLWLFDRLFIAAAFALLAATTWLMTRPHRLPDMETGTSRSAALPFVSGT